MNPHYDEYWKDLIDQWMEINDDIGQQIMEYLLGYFQEINFQREKKNELNREFYMCLKQECCNGINIVKKDDTQKHCTSKRTYNAIRDLLSTKIGKCREKLYVTWTTPIDKIHTRNYYIAGIQGTHSNLSRTARNMSGGAEPTKPNPGVYFRAPYPLFQEICKKNGWRKPESIKPWSGEEANIRGMMLLEDGIVEV